MVRTAPTILYNAKSEVKVCDTDAQEAAARSAGFIHPKPLHGAKFPTTVYSRTGETLLVADDNALKDALKLGYSQDFVPIAEPAPTASKVSDELSRVFFAEISDLRRRVEDLEAAVTASDTGKKQKKD